jgi:sugar phosphate isomerase/epimerase
MRIHLGINNCFAVKRWPEPAAWARLVRETLGLGLVQFSWDLLDPRTEKSARGESVREILEAVEKFDLELSSTFTGLGAYSSNLLLHPNEAMREDAQTWYERAIELSAMLGATATGGHFGAFSCEDYADSERKSYLEDRLIESVTHLSTLAKGQGLEQLLWEPMPLLREAPATIEEAERLYEKVNRRAAVPIRFCLDLGHQCTAGAGPSDRDPYEWLRRLGPLCPYIHLQQTDGNGDHHWPFTEGYNAGGIIHPEEVIESLEKSGAREVRLIFEIVHPFEAVEDGVLDDLESSVNYWSQFVG